jgi:hypothetical protein
MPTVLVPAQLTVKHLMAAVEQLSPAELHEFTQQFTAWQKRNSKHTDDKQTDEETALIQVTKTRLPAAEARRLKQLMAKSERGTLPPKELDEYRALAQRAEQLNVMRVEALAELVRQQGQPVNVVMEAIGWESGEDGA